MRRSNVLEDDHSERETMEAVWEHSGFISDIEYGDDSALVEAAKFDPLAFGELYERYHARVYRYVFHRLDNASDSEDVTALVFLKALEALPSYHGQRSTFAPWIFRITRNAVVDFYRRRKSVPMPECMEHEALDPDPAVYAVQVERAEALHMLVDRLLPDQRDVVLLRFAADLSFSEIAVVMNRNEPAVRMLLHRSLRKLKAVIDDEKLSY